MKTTTATFLLAVALGPILFGACSTPSDRTSTTPVLGSEKSLSTPLGEDCVSAAAWLQANQAHLPSQPDEFFRLPMNYRRAAFGALPPGAQSSLWRRHLEEYLAARSELTPPQTVLVRELVSLASPDLFAKLGDATRRHEAVAALDALVARTAQLFSASEQRTILAELGAPEAVIRAHRSGVSPAAFGDCNCSVDSVFCGSGLYCKRTGCPVKHLGCGTLWLYDCDGECFWSP